MCSRLILIRHFLCSTDCMEGDILLYDGSTLSNNHSNGTVLVCLDNEYGTVCDDWWDPLDATVVCTQLGFSATGLFLMVTSSNGFHIPFHRFHPSSSFWPG